METIDRNLLEQQILQVLEELKEQSSFEQGDLFIVGCSTSEVQKKKIGTSSSKEIGEIICSVIYKWCEENGLYMGAQCCEHLNRAIVVEEKYQKEHGLRKVNVIPRKEAGGSFATATYHYMKHPVIVEYVKAQLGIDIGNTLIGMHLQEVVVPVRTSINFIGEAHVVCAKTRPKFIGGCRAIYDETLI